MNIAIREEASRRGISRLCHFTPSRKLLHIAAGRVGILATAKLEATDRDIFDPTDRVRLDKHPGHVCCSIEYPNSWYFQKARAKEVIYPDWVVLLIDPAYLWKEGTLFCPRNASAESGRLIVEGLEGFRSLFADRVQGNQGKSRERTEDMLPCCPTDDQAEVLVPDLIQLKDIMGVAVRDEEEARRVQIQLRLSALDPNTFRYVITSAFYRRHELSGAIRRGERPVERWLEPI